MEIIETRKEPKDVALELAGQDLKAEAVPVAVTYKVWLTNDGGYFRIHWEASHIGSYDWAGLYVNQDLPDTDYIGGNNWQWTQYGYSYKTATAVQKGYQARYLVWDAVVRKYVSAAKSNPWP